MLGGVHGEGHCRSDHGRGQLVVDGLPSGLVFLGSGAAYALGLHLRVPREALPRGREAQAHRAAEPRARDEEPPSPCLRHARGLCLRDDAGAAHEGLGAQRLQGRLDLEWPGEPREGCGRPQPVLHPDLLAGLHQPRDPREALPQGRRGRLPRRRPREHLPPRGPAGWRGGPRLRPARAEDLLWQRALRSPGGQAQAAAAPRRSARRGFRHHPCALGAA
mmetsp:Transcript_11269/g.30685  ORF Transcript_11269/g.30685 Transcript_11269/m.30685 type:complete len:219 (+) Transcript_11269:595-1251(+)